MQRSLSLINARLGSGEVSTLRISGTHIAALAEPAHTAGAVLDLDGDRVLPGLINAHDHLQLNGFPRLNYRGRYTNVREWIADIQTRLHSDAQLTACHAVARDDRLLLGGIKNLLSGATTVAHHDPLYFFLLTDGFPVRVVEHYGWSHSLSVDGEEKVRESCRQTSAEWPWIIHAAEGIDDAAAREFDRLEALGCIGANTVLVHGVALDDERQARLARAGGGLVWCPSSNLHLFEQTVDAGPLIAQGRVALGTDSRLSGARDLLTELRVAREISGMDEPALEALVTSNAASLLRLPDRGALRSGALADILVLPAGVPLSQAKRTDIRLVLIDGRVCYGDEDCVVALGAAPETVQVRVDGRIKRIRRTLVEQMIAANIAEPGLEIMNEEAMSWPAAAYC